MPIRRIGTLELPDISRAGDARPGGGGRPAVALISAAAWSGSWETVLLFLNGGRLRVGRPELRARHRLLRLRPALLAVPPGLGRDVAGGHHPAQPGDLCGGRAALAAASHGAGARAPVDPRRAPAGGDRRSATSSTSPSFRTRPAAISGTIQAATYTDMHAQVPAYVILTVVALAVRGAPAGQHLVPDPVAPARRRLAWIGHLDPGRRGLPRGRRSRSRSSRTSSPLERPYIAAATSPRRARHSTSTRSTAKPFTGEQAAQPRRFNAEHRRRSTTCGCGTTARCSTRSASSEDPAQLLRLPRRRHRPLPGRRHGAPDHAERARARELALADEAQTWTNERLFYTHGYGITAVPVNAVTPEGQPDYLVSGINRSREPPRRPAADLLRRG